VIYGGALARVLAGKFPELIGRMSGDRHDERSIT
jgi:hypothetical protein